MNKHRLLPLFIALIGLHACTTTQPACAKDEARHTPKKHFALGYIADKGWTKGALRFEASPFRATPILPTVDLAALMPPDDDQGQVGRCTGFGLVHAMYAALVKAGFASVLFSPNFVYFNERVIMGTVNQDSGAMIGEDGITTLKAKGACLLASWPTSQDYRQKPSTCAYTEGMKHLVIQAYKVDNRNGQDFERAMSAGFVVVIGITLHGEFEDLDSRNYVYRGKGTVIGGHCMVAYKYNLTNKTTADGIAPGMARIRNQWNGKLWGRNDDFDMPLSLVHSSAVDDCWVIQVVAVPAK